MGETSSNYVVPLKLGSVLPELGTVKLSLKRLGPPLSQAALPQALVQLPSSRVEKLAGG